MLPGYTPNPPHIIFVSALRQCRVGILIVCHTLVGRFSWCSAISHCDVKGCTAPLTISIEIVNNKDTDKKYEILEVTRYKREYSCGGVEGLT